MPAHRARKRFGQHFLVDPGVIDAIVRAVNATEDDVIVEIGPGQGAITDALAQAAGELHVVELDRDLAAALRTRYADKSTVTVHEGDALQFDFSSIGGSIRVVGNLPYNISTPLLFHLLEYREHILDMHFMLQKEVVDRLAADPGSKTYGRLSVMAQYACAVTPLLSVPPGAFRPPPKVDSTVVRLVPHAKPPVAVDDPERLRRLVTAAFAQRRKTLRNTLRDHIDAEAMRAAGVDPGRRAETLSLEEFAHLANLS